CTNHQKGKTWDQQEFLRLHLVFLSKHVDLAIYNVLFHHWMSTRAHPPCIWGPREELVRKGDFFTSSPAFRLRPPAFGRKGLLGFRFHHAATNPETVYGVFLCVLRVILSLKHALSGAEVAITGQL